MANMKEYPKIDELFSANSEKLIPEDKERIVVEYMAAEPVKLIQTSTLVALLPRGFV